MKSMDNIQHGKVQKILNPFHAQNVLISKVFSNFSARGARINSNVHQFCKIKSSCFMRETAVIFRAFFDDVG